MALVNIIKQELTVWFRVRSVRLLELRVKSLPLLVEILPVVVVLLNCELLLLGGVHSQSFFEGEGVNLLQDGLQGNQTLLQNPGK